MKTVSIRYLGAKKNKQVDLPIGAASQTEFTGTVLCNPVGEFPADQAKLLLAVAGASKLFVLESEYQAANKPKEEKPKAPAKPIALVKKGKGKNGARSAEILPPAA